MQNNKFIWIAIPVLVLFVLSKMVFWGEIPLASDTLHNAPIVKWVEDYQANNSDTPLWYPHAFSGMPSYGSFTYTPGDPTLKVRKMLFFNRGVYYWFYFMIGGIGLYLFGRRKNLGSLSSLFAGIIYGLSPYLFGLINAGHSTKIMALGYAPWVFLAADYCIVNRKWRGVLFLAIAAALQMWTNHPQIVYFTWMIIVFWWIWTVACNRISAEYGISQDLKMTALLVGGVVLALLMVSDPYVSIYEFQKESNRGAKSVLDETEETASGTTWDYATNWSFEPKEAISFLYPYYYGLQNFPTRDIRSAAYWGGMPFTQSTHYFGVLTILMAILGALLKKPDRFQIYLWVTAGLIVLVGFGSYFPILFGPLYKLAPFYSKFRVPSMIYSLLPLPMGLLAAFGLENLMLQLSIFKDEERIDLKKKLFYLFGGILIFSAILLFASSLIPFLKPGESDQYDPRIISQIINVRKELYDKGVFLVIAIVGAALGGIWLGFKKWFRPQYVAGIIIALTIIDLWFVGSDFIILKSQKSIASNFRPTDITAFLTKDRDHFRIYPIEEYNSNWYGYFGIPSIAGYRPVKLRTYQDLLDGGGLNSLNILNMLNVKYLLTERQLQHPDFQLVFTGSINIYRNNRALPKAWMVSHAKCVSNQNESLSAVLSSDFNPEKMAVVVADGISIPDIENTGVAAVDEYSENQIVINVTTSDSSLLVLSEIFYSPGWNVSIDGEKSTIYQTNHVLRSVIVPGGGHEVRFWYDKTRWLAFKGLSRVTLFIVVALLVFLYRALIINLIKPSR